MLGCIYDEKTQREKEDVMMNCNWIFRDLMAKKRIMREAGIDISELEIWKDGKDPEKRISEAFKKAGLKMPSMNNRGVA